jgi:hypothetical protein
MSHQTTVDEDYENQISSSSLLRTNQRASQSQLLTRIYYPDTLYPDNYSFFADRGDTASSSQIKSPVTMEPQDQYATTDPSCPPTIVSTVPRQGTTEIEIIDRPSKYAVSIHFSNIVYCCRILRLSLFFYDSLYV